MNHKNTPQNISNTSKNKEVKMDYSSKLFGLIPYSVRDGETPSYSNEEVELMLSIHYGSVFAPMIYVKNVFHDNKNNGGVLNVDYFINNGGKDHKWFGQEYEIEPGVWDDIGITLQFQTVPVSKEEIDYAYQLFLAIEKHFSHDKQLTIIHPDDINTTYTRDEQIKAYNSAKVFIEKHKDFFDQLIKNDTPAMISFYLRAYLAGIDVYFKDSADDIIKKLEQNLRSKDNIVKRACKELGITQKELADILGVSKPSVERWAQGETPEQAVNQINLLLENVSLKKELEELKNAIKTITKYS